MTKQETRFKPGILRNETTRWKPEQSGNPAGKSKRRLLFEQAFNEALLSEGGPRKPPVCCEPRRRKEPRASKN